MDVFEVYLIKWWEYQKAVNELCNETDEEPFPSQQRQKVWEQRHQLKDAFKDAVKDTLLN